MPPFRFSASNVAKLYDMALAGDYLQTSNWPLGTKLTMYHIWDAFIISTLLKDHERQDTVLQVPHTGDQKDQFKDVMEECNNRFVLYGQPDAMRHVCNKCMYVFFMDGKYHELHPAMHRDYAHLSSLRKMSGYHW